MQAIILAAGRGQRMRPLTDGCHKTLLPVNGVTLIGSLLATLESAGIRKVLIVTGYDAERVEQHVRERFDHLALRFVHNEQYEVTNNIARWQSHSSI